MKEKGKSYVKMPIVDVLVDRFSATEIKDSLVYLVRENLLFLIEGKYLALPVERIARRRLIYRGTFPTMWAARNSPTSSR